MVHPSKVARVLVALALVLSVAACDDKAATPDIPKTEPAKKDTTGQAQAGEKPKVKSATPASLPQGLLVSMSDFGSGKPASTLVIVTREGGKWNTESLIVPEGSVFHKAFAYTPPGGKPGIVTLSGSKPKDKAAVKIWRKEGGAFKATTLWEQNFGGKFSRMRDAEVADFYNDGKLNMAVATHDQGIVAVLKHKSGDTFEAVELDKKPNTFVHEIEVGDLNGDKAIEVYSTPSEPNKLDGSVQKGLVMRYVPSKKDDKPTIVADLGARHAKEILVADVDGDGKDELYVAVEAEEEKVDGKLKLKSPVEIRRYDANTDPKSGTVIATFKDRLCRFLTFGDIDGDGKSELVAAPFRSGLWLLRPGADPKAEWSTQLIDKDSSGFEHASILADLDGDKRKELYVASDRQGELRRYTWNGKDFDKEVILKRDNPKSVLTWNLATAPVKLLK